MERPDLRARGIDLADASDDRLLVRCDGDTTLVAIFDGASSWGFGVDAARWTRERMAALWDAPSTLASGAIAEDLVSVIDDVPPAWNGEFGWSFAVMVVVARPRAVRLVGAGYFAATVLRDGTSMPVVEPRSLADDLVAKGQLSLEHLHAVPDVYLGPYLGDAAIVGASDLVRVETELLPGHRLVVAKANVLAHVATALGAWVDSGAEAIRARGTEEKCGTSPVLVVSGVAGDHLYGR